MVQITDYHLNDDSLQGYTLYELEVILNNYGNSLQDFGLKQPPEDLLTQLSNRLLMEERNYNVDALKNENNDLVPKLNVQQKAIYDLIINANSNYRQELIFVYGHGGTGKTFLWKAIISTLRSEEKIILAVTSSGIASLLLPSGRTAHSRFKLPLELIEESLCRITKNSHLGKLLADTDLIIWDEAILKENMRLARPYISLEERSMHSSNTVGSNTSTKSDCCPKNETADLVNSKVLDMVPGESRTYMSLDEAIPTGNNGAETEMLYPVEHLNTLKLPGFPPHHLELKVGTPVMLLRNVNLAGGLCNGTRMIVRQLMTKLIEVQIITGTRVGEKVFIHRIPLTHKDPNLPFIFKRRQFPIKLCYAMTINKSQG
ncbi:DNA helicase [Tanacetum coccineum]